MRSGTVHIFDVFMVGNILSMVFHLVCVRGLVVIIPYGVDEGECCVVRFVIKNGDDVCLCLWFNLATRNN